MRLDHIPLFIEQKHSIHAVVETPRGSRTKYAYEPDWETIVLKKTLPEGMVFPYDFGLIPCTKGQDGDPLDVLILMDVSTCPGCVVECRIVGAITAIQREKGKRGVRNDRFLAVETGSVLYRDIQDSDDLPPHFIEQLQEFFISYNKLAGKRFQPLRVLGRKQAWQALQAAAAV